MTWKRLNKNTRKGEKKKLMCWSHLSESPWSGGSAGAGRNCERSSTKGDRKASRGHPRVGAGGRSKWWLCWLRQKSPWTRNSGGLGLDVWLSQQVVCQCKAGERCEGGGQSMSLTGVRWWLSEKTVPVKGAQCGSTVERGLDPANNFKKHPVILCFLAPTNAIHQKEPCVNGR